MHNTRCVRRQKRCTIRTCLRLSGPLHRTSTSSHGGEATGTGSREPYPCPRQRHGSAHTRAPGQRPPHQAPVAQWIEQAPSKRLAAGSSPAGGATTRPPSRRTPVGRYWSARSGTPTLRPLRTRPKPVPDAPGADTPAEEAGERQVPGEFATGREPDRASVPRREDAQTSEQNRIGALASEPGNPAAGGCRSARARALKRSCVTAGPSSWPEVTAPHPRSRQAPRPSPARTGRPSGRFWAIPCDVTGSQRHRREGAPRGKAKGRHRTQRNDSPPRRPLRQARRAHPSKKGDPHIPAVTTRVRAR